MFLFYFVKINQKTMYKKELIWYNIKEYIFVYILGNS